MYTCVCLQVLLIVYMYFRLHNWQLASFSEFIVNDWEWGGSIVSTLCVYICTLSALVCIKISFSIKVISKASVYIYISTYM